VKTENKVAKMKCFDERQCKQAKKVGKRVDELKLKKKL